MRRAFWAALIMVLIAGQAIAQGIPGMVGVYADEAGTACNITDEGGLLTVHMMHVRTFEAGAVQFALDVSATDWIHLGDNIAFLLYFGTSVSGLSIAYQLCLTGSIYLGAANFLGSFAPPCTEIHVVPDPKWETIKAVGCEGAPMIPTGGLAYVNPNLSCQCSVPVEETTWGGIKALYR